MRSFEKNLPKKDTPPSSDDEALYNKGVDPKVFEEDLEFMKNHPLFMKELPKDFEKNEHIQALSNLIYDETPEQIAENMNKAGNDFMKKGSFEKYFLREALKKYTEGLEQQFENNDLQSRLYSNRGFVNLKLKNYGKAIEDSKKAIELNPKGVKPYFRSGSAYLALGKFEDAIQILNEALQIDENCEEAKSLLKDVQMKVDEQKAKEKSQQAQIDKKYTDLVEAFKQRKYVLGKQRIHEIPQAYERDPFVDPNGVLNVVTIITYLEFGQIDIIQVFSFSHNESKTSKETDVLEDHLKEIFKDKLPWDEHDLYKYNDLVAYVELNRVDPLFAAPYHTNFDKGYYRISKKKKLSDILKTDGFVLPFVLEIYIMSKKSRFYHEIFLKDYDIVKK